MQISQINSTTYGGKLNLDDIEIGDITAQNFKPHVKMKRWNGLCDLSISYPSTSSGLVIFDSQNNKITFPEDNNTDIEIYTKDPDDQFTEGAVEIDLVLKKKPQGNKNTFTFKVETDTIDFKKIVGLDQEYDQAKCQAKWNEVEGEQGEGHVARQGTYTITPTQIIHDATGEVMKTRDARLVNSYLGRAKQSYRVKSELGEITANTPNKGKQLSYTRVSRTKAHLRRGKAKDADGVEAWVEDMNLDQDGNLTITLPLDFIKNAKYPIRQAVGVDPAYTEAMDVIDGTGFTEGAWTAYDIEATDGYTSDMVVEIIITNDDTGKEYGGGVRTYGSSLAGRYTLLHEAEGGGRTTCRMFVQPTDNAGSGNIEYYSGENTDVIFTVVGYWENTSFTEKAEDIGNPSSYDTWEEKILGDSGAASRVCHLHVDNIGADTANYGGVRETISSTDRRVLVHEPEAGGTNSLDMMVKADASYTIDQYQDSTGINIIWLGYFGSEMDFVEDFSWALSGAASWTTSDMSPYIDEDGRVLDMLLIHDDINNQEDMGVRDGDDTTTERKFTEHEAEDNGSSTNEKTGFGMSVKTNATGLIYHIGPVGDHTGYFMGYFKPAGATTQTAIPDGIASGVALGEPNLKQDQTVIPDGIAGGVALGEPVLTTTITIEPDGIASGVALGEPKLNLKVEPNGIASTVALGEPLVIIDQTVEPDGITSTIALGEPKLNLKIFPDGVASTVALGEPVVTSVATIIPDGIGSTVALGEPQIDLTIFPDGIASTVALGEPEITTAGEQIPIPDGIASTVAFGTLTIIQEQFAIPDGIAPAVAFGTLNIAQDQVVEPNGISSTVTFGTPKLNLKIYPDGVSSTITIGSPQLNLIIFPDGLGSTITFGTITILQEQTVSPNGITSGVTLGTPQLNLTIFPDGLASSVAFGTLSVWHERVLRIIMSPIVSAHDIESEIKSAYGIKSKIESSHIIDSEIKSAHNIRSRIKSAYEIE